MTWPATRDPLVERMRPFGTTIFAEMTALAVATGAINLGQGFPDSDGPPAMLEAARQAIAGGLNQYPPGPGLPTLRAAIAADRKARYRLEHDPGTEVLVTVGATEGISAALLAVCETGDEVLMLEPYYDSYAAATALAGGVRRTVPLRPDRATGRFGVDLDELRAAVTPRTRVLLLNSPHNPTGTVLDAAELGAIAELCCEHGLVAITDEVYEHLTYDGVQHLPLATFPGMAERTISVSSAAKTFSVTGWKIGWVCGPAPLVAAVAAVKQFLTFASGAPLQAAVGFAIEHESAWVDAQRDSLAGRRDRLAAGLRSAGFEVHPSEGTYFIQADARPLGYADGVALARQLPELAGVVAIPTAVFCDRLDTAPSLLRFAFCKQPSVIDEAVRRLAGLGRP
jgi:N-succinyldiaminopimelate aminotransferase